MRLTLSQSEQTQLAATARILLTPLDEPIDRWRAEVLRHVTRLLGTEMGGFILPTGEDPICTLQSLPDEFARDYLETIRSADSHLSAFQRKGGGVWSTRMPAKRANRSREDGWFGSAAYREFFRRYRIEEAIGFGVPIGAAPELPAAPRLAPGVAPMSAVLSCFHGVSGTEQLGERGLAMLRLLLPALEAGVAGRARLAWVRTTLQDTLDHVRDGLLLCDADGRRLYVNTVLTGLLQSEPEGESIRIALERISITLCGLLRAPGTNDPCAGMEAVGMEVRTGRARYRVRGNLLSGAPFHTGPLVLVNVERLTPEPSSLAQLRERWDLTAQEARVAQLLARGLSSVRIATELGLSPTTVRHYTEAVFLKLEVHSRSEAAYRIAVG